MEKEYQFWSVTYENPNTGETHRASVSAKTKKGARSEAERSVKNTEWRVKAVTEMPEYEEASDEQRTGETAQHNNIGGGSMTEPVNIMGMVAFPNPSGARDIRFIDSHYNALFKVPDGGNVVIKYLDGTAAVRSCTYIDDHHAKIGSNVYHIAEFAEVMEQNGSTYAPEQPREGDVYDTYEIYQIKNIAVVDYVFCPYDEAKNSIKALDYHLAYAGMLAPNVSLDAIYEKHNRDDRPFGRRMRSLSVSDVIVVTHGGERKAFYVDSVGYWELAWEGK